MMLAFKIEFQVVKKGLENTRLIDEDSMTTEKEDVKFFIHK